MLQNPRLLKVLAEHSLGQQDTQYRSYQSRHTAATTVFLSNGVPIETVSSMLGHKSIKTTQIYAKITKEKLNQDMENLVARLGSIEEFKGCNI